MNWLRFFGHRCKEHIILPYSMTEDKPKGTLTYAFDIDRTLTRFPVELRSMMRGLVIVGHKVIVLTGKMCIETYTQELNPDRYQRVEQLTALGIYHNVHYHKLYIACGIPDDGTAVGKAKAEILKELDACMFVDDTSLYLEAARNACKDLCCLHVVP